MSGHMRLNLALIPGLDADVGVVRFYAQLRLAGQVVILRSIVGGSEDRAGE